MTAHEWQVVPERSRVGHILYHCPNCGAYRLRSRTLMRTQIFHYTPPGANINHCLAWYRDEPLCEAPPEITVIIRRAES